MEEIDLKEMFNYFWQKRLFVIFAVLLALFIGLVYGLFIEVPKYKSYTTILLTKENDSTQITSSDVTLNNNLVDTYREIVKSNKVIDNVIADLNLSYSTDTLKKNITVESVNDTELIKITVTDTDPELAKNIANETAKVFNSEIITLYNLENISVVDTAKASDNPSNMNLAKELVIAFLIGLVVSLGIIFMVYYFDNTIRSAEDIERKLKVPVIGNIPLEEEK